MGDVWKIEGGMGEMEQQKYKKLMSRVRAQLGVDESSPSSKCKSESALIPN